jgi:hypothetical protein
MQGLRKPLGNLAKALYEREKTMNIDEILSNFLKNLQDIREMMRILGQDCKEHYDVIEINNSQTHRRAYVRSVFAFIEGMLHLSKVSTVHLGVLFGSISPYELVILEGVRLEVDDKGAVISKPLYPSFLNNVRFTFRVSAKCIGSSFNLNVNGQGWDNLRKAVKVRDRLMHPKEVLDLEVSDAEINTTKAAFEWFFISYTLSSHYTQKAIQAKTSASFEDIENLNTTIQRMEADLAIRDK